MSIFSRVSDIINANVSDLLDRAEDPEKMVKMLIFEMEEQIDLARQSVVKAIAGEKKLESNLTKNRDEAASWYAKAEAAVGRGDEDLARKCLARKKEHALIVDSLLPQHSRAQQTSDSLKINLLELEEKLEEAVRRRDSLIARQLAAQATKEMQNAAPAMNRVHRNFEKFNRMERRIEEMEFEAVATAEVAPFADHLCRDVERAEKNAQIESELAILKAAQLESNR